MAKIPSKTRMVTDSFVEGARNLETWVQDLQKQRKRNKILMVLMWTVPILVLVVAFSERPTGTLLFILLLASIFVAAFFFHNPGKKDLLYISDTATTLPGWKQDVHARSPLFVEVDGRPPSDRKARRQVRSAGGKMKYYYRYEFLTLKWALADGNLLACSLTARLKTKAGAEVRHEVELRGRLRLNPSLYSGQQLQNLRSPIQSMRVRLQPHGDHLDLCFWGPVVTWSSLDPFFRDLYRSSLDAARIA